MCLYPSTWRTVANVRLIHTNNASANNDDRKPSAMNSNLDKTESDMRLNIFCKELIIENALQVQ